MLQKSAEQTSRALTDTFANTRSLMTSDNAYRGITSPLEIKAADERISAKEAAPQEDIGTGGVTDFVNYQDAILRGQVGTKAARVSKFGDDLFNFEPKGVETARGRQPVEFTDAATRQAMTTDEAMRGRESMTRDEMLAGATTDEGFTLNTRAAKEADFASGKPGISTREAKEAGFASGTYTPKRSALETVSTSLRTTKDSVLSKIKTPMMMVLDAVTKTSPQQQNRNEFNRGYFNVREDGRIAGNPATDVFAGMNRESAFGDVGKSARGRIETREKTIEKKGYGPGDKFYDDTQKMKDQVNDYQGAKNKSDLDKGPGALGPAGGATNDGGGSGGGGKIVCTMMNQRYGFGSFRNKIWLKFHKDYSPEYQKGYHKLFLPLVNIAKQEGIFNTVVRKILEHMGRHVTADMFQIMRNKKSDKLGRLYRKIFEPICYWLGGK